MEHQGSVKGVPEGDQTMMRTQGWKHSLWTLSDHRNQNKHVSGQSNLAEMIECVFFDSRTRFQHPLDGLYRTDSKSLIRLDSWGWA